MKKLIALLLCLPLVGQAATTYWVTKSGNDGNTGASIAQAKLTVQAGINLLVGGDTLNVGAGTYDEDIDITDTASGANWAGATTIQGTNVTLAWVTAVVREAPVLIQAHYIIWNGLKIDNSGYDETLYGPGVGDGGPSSVQINGANGHHVMMTNITILGPPHGMGILIDEAAATGGNQILSCTISNMGWGFVSTASGDTFYHAIYFEQPDNVVSNCILGPAGLGSRNHLDLAKNAGIHMFEGTGITNNTLVGNTIQGPLYRGFSVCGDPGLGLYNGGWNKIYNNTVTGVEYGMYINYYAPSNQIYNNTFFRCNYGIYEGDLDYGGDLFAGQMIANNIFDHITNGVFRWINTRTISHLTNNLVYSSGTLHTGTAYTETGTVTDNPSMTDPATGVFTLNSDSAAINAGVDLSSMFTTDKAQVTRVGAFDIGAYEYSAGDVDAPTITAVTVHLGTTWAGITWTTDELATSGIEWGPTAAYGSSATNSSSVISHSLNATPLTDGTHYHYRVHSTDPSGNTAASADGIFTTLTPVVGIKATL